MPLPFSLAGRVEVPEVSDVDLAASGLESALEALKPKRIQRIGARLDFNGGSYILRRVTRLNLLNISGSGKLAVERASDGMIIRYRITFARWFWFVTLSVPLASASSHSASWDRASPPMAAPPCKPWRRS
jgi:hypothetical protein